ncbi:MAG: thioredoxin family protein [Deltaproteobacteria bacterium]|nr:thioredoxin family protein [Deltaproteobacteria bacterium]
MICWIVGGAFILESSLMTRLKLTLIVCLAFLIPGLVAPALATNQIQLDSKPPIKIEVNTYPAKVAAGQEGWVVASIVLDPGWHIYGNPKGPGPGLPTILEVTSLPDGVTADPSRFLPAEKFLEPDLGPDEWVWAYKNKTSIYVRLSTPGNLSSGSHQVQLLLRALLCREGLCMPYKTDLAATLTIVSSPETAGAIPLQVRKNIGLTHVAESKVTLAPSFSSSTPLKPIKELSVQPGEIPELHPRPVLPSLEVGSMVKAALFALLAGFILNFMPCVLPVVSLKVLGFVQQSQESGRRVAFMGLSFAAGIFAVFLVLAALASFAGYGWGELFQKQSFLITMIGLVFAMSLCLFGVFQLPIPHFATNRTETSAQRHGYLESFYKGTLATFLATPCSGPLLGGAMAWTLRQPPVQIFTVFSCLGLGMAAPYVVMSLFPNTLRWLPRPGSWLIHFERLMGFALLATVIYLLTVLPEHMTVGVVLFCFFLAIGFYIWGKMTTLSDSTRRRLIVRLTAVIIMVVGGWVSLDIVPSVARNVELVSEKSQQWESYTHTKLLEAARKNRWVVVDFTADWCPNCLLVEKTVLHNRTVVETFRKHDALLLKADLTMENPPAKRLLQKLGSRSIPFLAFFPPGENFWQPYFLRDLYRVKDVLEVFEGTTSKSS